MTQVVTKAIEDNAVNDEKVRLRNSQYLRARNNANTADVPLLRANTGDQAEFGAKPVSPFVPSNNNDLATVAWVKSYADGMRDPKEAVRACSSSSIDLASMPSTVDSISLNVNDRFAVINQTTPSENGIYIFNGTGLAATRSLDADEYAEVTQGLSFDVVEGLVNGAKRYLLTTANPIVVGTTNLVFVKVPNGNEINIPKYELLTLDAGHITNQYIDLANDALQDSLQVYFSGILQKKNIDYSMSIVANKTRITFLGDLAMAGRIELISGDQLEVYYDVKG